MGTSLTLLPLFGGPGKLCEISVLCYNRLDMDTDYQIFSQIIDMSYRQEEGISKKPTIQTYPIPPQMWVRTYGDEGIEKAHEDGDGKALTFVYAQQLKKLRIPDNASSQNKAIKAFVDALPDDVPIILMWH